MRYLLLCFVFLISVSTSWGALSRGGKLQGAHGDRQALPKTCRACHRGMNMSISGEEGSCLSCHGSTVNRTAMQERGYLGKQPGVLKNIEAELVKPYRHPVLDVKGVHRQGEALPEEIVNATRHSECVDCHDPHLVSSEAPFRGLKGRRVGNFIADIKDEYELCYRCHSSSANLPVDSTDKHLEFKVTNRSFHPVEGEGRNKYVISLLEPYNETQERQGDVSIISCSSCHGSDEIDGPRGPHGSRFRGLLKYNYEMDDGRNESYYAYQLCYTCHDRNSILGDESFSLHSLHILGDRSRGEAGTSCFTCHDAHGSQQNQYLIRFNEDVVRPAANGRLEYKAQGVASRHGSCTLSCHGVEHDALSY
ncbi:hypothetical protein B5V00_02330 [Geothermobacter hydrogeniphilus]|uniref:nitrite reductase (cytochrome; ammonia-forming) n=1 Tax=Geothermobacter hydrogeniphilus TaxID=1969733 RepID=A0A1X0YCL0_9BACT|nr:hypothetical protein B5V00_02330 [Geothermobacter hydrogeniphilus]